MTEDVSHADIMADIKVLKSQFEGHNKAEERDRDIIAKRLDANAEAARNANIKIDALSNQLKGANILFSLALAAGGIVIGWLASLGFGNR